MNKILGCLLAVAVFSGMSAQAQSVRTVVADATDILEKRQGSAEPIPASALAAAKGVAIFTLTKAGFVIGGQGGDGVVIVKRGPGLLPAWTAPIPFGLGGASFGAQIGGTTTRAIVLLNSDRAVKVFTAPGKLGWNANASGTAGAESQHEQEGGLLSDVDVTIYKDTGGLYGGAVFGGSELKIQDERIKAAYGASVFERDILDGKVPWPDYSARLYVLLSGKR